MRTDTYLTDNARYDPYLQKQLNRSAAQQINFVDMSDTICKGLLNSLGYDPEKKGCDVGSRITGASNLTGDGDMSGALTMNLEATANRDLRTREYAKQLADLHEKNAEQATEINALKAQTQQLTEMIAGLSQQGTPHLSGSGATRPQDLSSGVAPQGS